MKLLFVEDDDDKAQKIASHIFIVDSSIDLLRAKSFMSALKFLVQKDLQIDGVILDMSMPNFDNSQEAPENFAGRDLLRQCKLRNIERPTFVITMLDRFGSGDAEITLEQLDQELALEFSPKYLGLVYYSSAQESWREELKIMINKMKEE